MTDVLDEPRSASMPGDTTPPLSTIEGFGSNPGNLEMRLFKPRAGGRGRPLVVVLHGCRQTVEAFDTAAGWSRLADQHDFMLVYPEQRSANNRDLCFSWFERGDICRGQGEVESIRQMVGAAIEEHGADARRVFVCGLSAGGAMASAALAAYPEVFAGGAIIAGLPYGAAWTLHEAYESMSGRVRDAKIWGDAVRAASSHNGPWPSVSAWHGTADKVVSPVNAGEIVKQWTNVHELGASVPAEDHTGSAVRRVWHDKSGRACVTDYTIPGLAHGVPVADRDPPAPFFLPAGISSTWHIARDWGLFEPQATFAQPAASAVGGPTGPRTTGRRLLSFFGL